MSEENSGLLEFFRKIGNTVLGLKKLPRRLKDLKEETLQRARSPERKVPSYLRNFFRQRHAGWPEYVILKIQITIVLLFGFTAVTVLIKDFWLIFGSILFLLSLYAALLTKFQLKAGFKLDYPAYRSFVGICVGLAWGAVLLLNYPMPAFGEELLKTVLPIAIVLVGAVLSFAGFRAKYGRDHTYGIVQEVKNGKTKVRTRYDLRSNTKQGVYFVDSFVPVEKNDVVKVRVDRSTLGLRGSTVRAITEKAPERKETLV
ncbi:hypothetical protein AKJ57_01910 [candidate division MSBL1 archaeon SCGC-AAA259A05]|uniref:DUF2101 domain-containing protein n=1 Tax=candidate division MSBL1 archaeon SCGC-AAA259A05 TaxID=1698259 RepID=A0A133UAR6_9EURY|nr:hypothetical protein AKJ57_01910 [candidate division MSBL1 archaeon SCGC-AAA259A05]